MYPTNLLLIIKFSIISQEKFIPSANEITIKLKKTTIEIFIPSHNVSFSPCISSESVKLFRRINEPSVDRCRGHAQRWSTSEVSTSLCRFSIKRSTNNLPRLFYLSQEPSRYYSRHWERARFQDNPSCITLMSSGLHLPARPRERRFAYP